MKGFIATIVISLGLIAFVYAQCDQTGLSSCASTLGTCVHDATGSKDTICACYGTFVGCSKNVSCTGDSLASYTKTCDQYGCDIAQ